MNFLKKNALTVVACLFAFGSVMASAASQSFYIKVTPLAPCQNVIADLPADCSVTNEGITCRLSVNTAFQDSNCSMPFKRP